MKHLKRMQAAPNSIKLKRFSNSIMKATSEDEKNKLWDSIESPFIENINENKGLSLVTFLYRSKDNFSKTNTVIYLASCVTGYKFSEKKPIKCNSKYRYSLSINGIT